MSPVVSHKFLPPALACYIPTNNCPLLTDMIHAYYEAHEQTRPSILFMAQCSPQFSLYSNATAQAVQSGLHSRILYNAQILHTCQPLYYDNSQSVPHSFRLTCMTHDLTYEFYNDIPGTGKYLGLSPWQLMQHAPAQL